MPTSTYHLELMGITRDEYTSIVTTHIATACFLCRNMITYEIVGRKSCIVKCLRTEEAEYHSNIDDLRPSRFQCHNKPPSLPGYSRRKFPLSSVISESVMPLVFVNKEAIRNKKQHAKLVRTRRRNHEITG